MIEKAYSVFLYVLLISVLFFPLTTAGRVLRDTPQKEGGSGNRGNGRNKMGVQPNKSDSAHSATEGGSGNQGNGESKMAVRPTYSATGRSSRNAADKPVPDGSGNHGNGGYKIDVHGSPSKHASSKTSQSPPSHATPSRKSAYNHVTERTLSCGPGESYSECIKAEKCGQYKRPC